MELEILKQGRQLISDPRRWTVGTYARDHTGQPVDSISPAAVKWCSIGAIHKAAHDMKADARVQRIAAQALEAAVRTIASDGRETLSNFNDKVSHQTLLRAWELAIAVQGGVGEHM